MNVPAPEGNSLWPFGGAVCEEHKAILERVTQMLTKLSDTHQ
ncbi:MAG: hypothetical protein ACREQ9_27390 [Candidatus Binatia bacterium]